MLLDGARGSDAGEAGSGERGGDGGDHLGDSAFLITSVETLDQIRFWQVGALTGRTIDILWQVAPFLGVGILLALTTGRILDGLAMGDDVARGLGQRVQLSRAYVGLVAVILACGDSGLRADCIRGADHSPYGAGDDRAGVSMDSAVFDGAGAYAAARRGHRRPRSRRRANCRWAS